MNSHLAYTLLFALLVSAAAALPGNRPARDRACAAAYTFVSCTLTVIAGSWVMFWIHG
jgi:hypothetical protein